MDLNVFLKRLQEIEQAIVSTANQYQALIGHKTEIQHWIGQLQNPPQENENKVDDKAVNESEPVVE